MSKDDVKLKVEYLSTTAQVKCGIKTLRAALLLAGATSGLLGIIPHQAHALNVYDGTMSGNNLEINLDTTISYTGIVRTNNPSRRLTGPANINGSEGDINFAHGLVSNEFEILPILDVTDGRFGAHFSGEAYVNTSYLGTNQNSQAYSLNPISVGKNTDFTSATRNVEGLNARVLDAFVYGTQHFGADDSQAVTLKVGRQTLLWGQSLFLANNGIAAGMAPFDVVTSDNNPNAQTQQKIEPVGQVVLTYQPNSILTLQGYYQFEWAHDYLEGVGAYFSSTDILDKGGQRLLFAPGFGALRTKDLSPENNNGQFGASAQFALGNYDVGLYGLRYDSKAPTVYLNAGTFTYSLAYPRDIWIEGASVSTTVGPANVAGELSSRQHMNLTTGLGFVSPFTPANANSNPLYPVGDTLAGQVSAIYVSPGIPLDPGGVTVDGEIGFNHVLKVTANKSLIAGGRSSTAANLQMVATPNYYNVLPNLSLGFPIGFAYTFYGRSEVDSTENHGTGSINFGVTATYKVTWIASFTFNDYLGAANPGLAGEPSVADRNYVLLNLQHSF
jgi:hypothetical protein